MNLENLVQGTRATLSQSGQKSRSIVWYHLCGATVSAIIITVAWMIWDRSQIPVTTLDLGNRIVDVDEAVRLVSEADQWRKRYAHQFRKSEQIAERGRQIKDWLSDPLDQETMGNHVESIAAASGLVLIDSSSPQTIVGRRVGVVSASIEAQGSLASIGRFLNSLSDGGHHLVCSEVVIKRMLPGPDGEPPLAECTATLTLRLAHAAEDTPAGMLLEEGTSDES